MRTLGSPLLVALVLQACASATPVAMPAGSPQTAAHLRGTWSGHLEVAGLRAPMTLVVDRVAGQEVRGRWGTPLEPLQPFVGTLAADALRIEIASSLEPSVLTLRLFDADPRELRGAMAGERWQGTVRLRKQD